jgi:hypothetical protein
LEEERVKQEHLKA